MTVLFTPEDLVRYLYNDTSHEQKVAIEAALMEDWTLREKLEVLKSSAEKLDRIEESPRTEAVLNVLNYARQTATEHALSR